LRIPRDLSGSDLIKCLCRHWEYRHVTQKGSHVRLETFSPSFQRITVPDHDNLAIGTLTAILKSVAAHKGVEIEDILGTL
jgi:predicted RNA binding protein YcfA (HicA-like mRNA interferase family)